MANTTVTIPTVWHRPLTVGVQQARPGSLYYHIIVSGFVKSPAQRTKDVFTTAEAKTFMTNLTKYVAEHNFPFYGENKHGISVRLWEPANTPKFTSI